jgi:DNA-directed RNA polymerase specialized sigma24 family protein
MRSHEHINQEIFQSFLNALAADPEEASVRYGELRQRLVRYFQLRGLDEVDDAADEALDRVAMKLEEGQAIEDFTRYSYGVARFVLLERLRRQQKENAAAARFQASSFDSSAGDDRSHRLLECLAELDRSDRALILDYFVKDTGKSADRLRLADRHGITLNNLRLRIFRLKKRLAECVTQKNE